MDHYTALKKQPKKKDRTCYKDVSSLCVIYTSTYTEHIVHGIYRVACMCIHTQICICTCMYVYKTFFPRTMIKSWENISNNSTHKTISQHGRAKKRRLKLEAVWPGQVPTPSLCKLLLSLWLPCLHITGTAHGWEQLGSRTAGRCKRGEVADGTPCSRDRV